MQNQQQEPPKIILDNKPAVSDKQKISFKNRRSLLFLAIILVGITGATVLIMGISTKKATAPVPQVSVLGTPKIEAQQVVTGLDSPTAIVASSDSTDKRLFVLERAGDIRIVKAGKLEAQPYLDIKTKVLGKDEMGLLGLAFHPEYKQNGLFYVNYVDKDQNTIIARYHAAAEGAADASSEKVLLKFKQPYPNHNGGDLHFGPDGFLYIAVGDGGSAGDPENRAQSKGSFFGKILRLDVNKGDPYTIPASNPFASTAGARPEIWAYGLRNPWRISFDKKTGDLYIADVGQGDNEEVNFQKAGSKGGENYGWRCYEGNADYKLDRCLDKNNYVFPAFQYDHSQKRCSITGGYVYRGSLNPALAGKYFYGDYCTGQLFYAQPKGSEWQQTLATDTEYAISAFGQDNDGELYFADFKTGTVYKIADSAN